MWPDKCVLCYCARNSAGRLGALHPNRKHPINHRPQGSAVLVQGLNAVSFRPPRYLRPDCCSKPHTEYGFLNPQPDPTEPTGLLLHAGGVRSALTHSPLHIRMTCGNMGSGCALLSWAPIHLSETFQTSWLRPRLYSRIEGTDFASECNEPTFTISLSYNSPRHSQSAL